MEYSNYMLFAISLGGVLLHNLIKIQKLNKEAEGNFNGRKFFKLEWPTIAISVGVCIISLMIKNDIAKLDAVSKYLGVGFFAIGFMSQSILYTVMSKAEKFVKKQKEEDQ